MVTALGGDAGAGAPAGTLCAHSPRAPPGAGRARPSQGDTSESKEGSDRHADTDRGGQGLVPSRLYQLRDSQAGSGPWAPCSTRGVLAALQRGWKGRRVKVTTGTQGPEPQSHSHECPGGDFSPAQGPWGMLRPESLCPPNSSVEAPPCDEMVFGDVASGR